MAELTAKTKKIKLGVDTPGSGSYYPPRASDNWSGARHRSGSAALFFVNWIVMNGIMVFIISANEM